VSDPVDVVARRHAELAAAFDRTARAPLVAQVRAVVADFAEPFVVPYVTHAYLWQRTSATPS